MKSNLIFTLIANVVAVIAVALINTFSDFLGIRYWQDYAFYVVFLLWGIATLLYMYPPLGHGSGQGEPIDQVPDMVEGSDSLMAENSLREAENTQLFIQFLIAGVPSFALCLLLHFLGK